jgi:hypothetical protein
MYMDTCCITSSLPASVQQCYPHFYNGFFVYGALLDEWKGNNCLTARIHNLKELINENAKLNTNMK